MKSLKTTKKTHMLNRIKRKILSAYGKNLISLAAFGTFIKYNDTQDDELYLVIVTKKKKNFEMKSRKNNIYVIEKTPENLKYTLWLKGAGLRILYDREGFLENKMNL